MSLLKPPQGQDEGALGRVWLPIDVPRAPAKLGLTRETRICYFKAKIKVFIDGRTRISLDFLYLFYSLLLFYF